MEIFFQFKPRRKTNDLIMKHYKDLIMSKQISLQVEYFLTDERCCLLGSEFYIRC